MVKMIYLNLRARACCFGKGGLHKGSMFDDPELSLSEEQAMNFLERLMPSGFAGPEVLDL